MIAWFLRVSAWCSQTINLWVLFGHHDTTVSARCYINRNRKGWGVAYRVINKIFFWQDDHCRESFLADVLFAKEVLAIHKSNTKKENDGSVNGKY